MGSAQELTVVMTDELVERFAALSGDVNPLHMDDAAAREAGLSRRVCHGVLSLSFLSTLIGTRLPGYGALWRSLRVDWLQPVYPRDELTLVARVKQVSDEHLSMVLEIEGRNQGRVTVLQAQATVGVLEGRGKAAEAPSHPAAAPPAASPVRAPAAQPCAEWGRDAATRPVLVTGASRGIGRAIALRLARNGHPVAVGYHANEDAAGAVVRDVQAAGGRAVALQLDMDDAKSVADLAARAADALGPVLGFVHCATPPIDYSPAAELTAESLTRFWNAYVLGSMAIAQAMYPAIRQHGWGRIVFLGTAYLIGTPPPKMTGYIVAKGGLLALMRALAVEWGPVGATVNMISPSMTQTDLVQNVPRRQLLLEQQLNPRRRLAQVDDAADSVAYLLSDAAAFINGAHLPLTGGQMML